MQDLRSWRSCLARVLALACLCTPVAAAELVAYDGASKPGTIIVDTSSRRLYFVLERNKALRYVVGVGRTGRQRNGRSVIEGRFLEPNWVPPAAVRADHPELPPLVAGGSPQNPLGEAALTLTGGSYAIHGTNAPESIGGFVSHGCIRMYNEDILDLLARVRIGTPVEVTP